MRVEDPVLGTETATGPPLRLSRTPAQAGGPAPRLGEHTREVLGDELGLTPVEVEELIASGAAIVPGEAVNA